MTGSNTGAAQTPVLTNRDYIKTMLRSYFLQNGFNYSNYQGLGYANVIYPALKKIHGDDKQALCEDLEKNSEFYNTNPVLVPFITSLHLAMADQGMDYDEVRGLKMALMGPLAGIGDSLIVGTLIPILLGIAMGLSQGGSPLGAIFYIVVWNVLAYFGMRFAYYRGYDLGGAAVEALVGPNATALRESIVMIGTMVIGAVAATWVNITTAMTLPGGGTLQGTLDGIFPKLLPLGFTLLCWWLMAKKKVSPIVTMLILLAVAFIGAAVGFFGAATIAAPVA